MKTFRISVVWLALLTMALPSASQEKCDCNHFPWEPETCVDICGALVLSRTTVDEIATFLELKQSTAEKIVELRQNTPGRKFESLAPIRNSLPATEYKSLVQSFGQLTPLEAQYLVQTPGQRRALVDKLKVAPPGIPM